MKIIAKNQIWAHDVWNIAEGIVLINDEEDHGDCYKQNYMLAKVTDTHYEVIKPIGGSYITWAKAMQLAKESV